MTLPRTRVHRNYIKRPREGSQRAAVLAAIEAEPRTVRDLIELGFHSNRGDLRQVIRVLARKGLIEIASMSGNEPTWRAVAEAGA